ncbi:MAG: hypothetical protein HeimC2_21310 [Candidatus Heimdallarchaeota archaeon LC_2]|nr:MAG: hypothetical protein HeimC2_21310 [Candidatus Heimdallarchaeota archaeon LC_2]
MKFNTLFLLSKADTLYEMSQYKRLAKSLLLAETIFLILIIVFVPLGTGYLDYIKEPPITNWGLNYEESEVFQMKIHTMEIYYEFTSNGTKLIATEQGLYYANYFPTNYGGYRDHKTPLFNFSGNSVSNKIIDFEVLKIDYESTQYGVDGKTVDVATILIVDQGTSMIIPAHSDQARSPVSIDFRFEINGSYLFEKSTYLPIFDSENSRNAFNQMVKREPSVNINPQEKINQNKYIYPSASIREEQYGKSIYSWSPYINWTFYPDSSRFKFVDYIIHEKNRSIVIDGEIINYTFYVNLEIEWIYPEMIPK